MTITGNSLIVILDGPGSVHDAGAFDNSDLLARIKEDQFSMVANDGYLVGDAAYLFETFMMVPYKNTGAFSQQQSRYNYVQSATRNVIERSFALLKSRFARLKHVEVTLPEDLCSFIIACCAMHNVCIDKDLLTGELDFIVEPIEEVNNTCSTILGSTSADVERKRKEIANSL